MVAVKTEAALDEQELVFLKDFFELMDIAHYSCITEVCISGHHLPHEYSGICHF